MSQTEPCAACSEPITPGIDECPECGNNPNAKAAYLGKILTGVGVATAIFLIGIPILLIGLVMWGGASQDFYCPTKHDFTR